MKIKINKLSRLAYGAVALAMLAAVGVPALGSRASAYGQVTSRSIQMSTSTTGTA
jgi:hypothetical protein